MNIAGSRFCTGALISERIVATAAHCLFNPRTKARTQLSQIKFVAGLIRGAHVGMRRVRAVALPAGYRYTGKAQASLIGVDVALLELESPIENVIPFDTGSWSPASRLSIVSYARDRAHAPSIEEGCGVLGRSNAITALDCSVNFGSSGAPVFATGPDGRPQIVAIVSAQGRVNVGGRKVPGQALVVDIQPHLAALHSQLLAGTNTAFLSSDNR